MKKLMIAVATLCAAFGVQAATYGWNIGSDWISTNGELPLEGAVAYAFDANQNAMSAVVEALAGGSKAVLDDAMGSPFTISDEGWFTIAGDDGLTDDNASPTKHVGMYAIVVAQDDAGKDWFLAIDGGTKDVTEGIQGAGATFGLGDITTGAVGSDGWTQVAPEPTSGLLLLIGVAGLALRRRRA